ncbi:MerR family transcriptional regulator [Mesopusillimonas faecipullorum]|uniref:MerR family transcriptional regulator n=1 Tax=Mesopusillimonas faecipullorum TaxID=2755040 RepID=UPI001D0266DC|nr:MerR family transcriptional regulator [Mesopusillimonas faecipullorum]
MHPSSPTVNTDKPLTYRAGVAARLTGLSPETLRVWERRYQVSGAERTERGHRFYTAEQVRRLGVLKQLVDSGHAIGAIAHLPVEQLHVLLPGIDTTPLGHGPIRVAVIGSPLARRIASSGLEGSKLKVLAYCPRLDEAASLKSAYQVEVLLIESSELDDAAIPKILAAREAYSASAVVVLYRFCATATIRTLRLQGCLAARVPAEAGELVALCRSALTGERLPAQEDASTGMETANVPGIRFDEEWLSSITSKPNGVLCECPRHLADLLMMVGSFERYSAQCASRNEQDVRLHKDLELAAGRARAILETAMESLMRSEGLWS